MDRRLALLLGETGRPLLEGESVEYLMVVRVDIRVAHKVVRSLASLSTTPQDHHKT